MKVRREGSQTRREKQSAIRKPEPWKSVVFRLCHLALVGVIFYSFGAYFPSDMTQVSCLDLAFVCVTQSCRRRLHSKPVDLPQVFAVQPPRHGDLRHLESDVPRNVRDGHSINGVCRPSPKAGLILRR